jgi:transposase
MPSSDRATPAAGLTVAEVARRYRVGEDKVRGWIRRGELRAINTATALCGKPRWVILPDDLVTFEKRRTSEPPPKPVRRRKQTHIRDYSPD